MTALIIILYIVAALLLISLIPVFVRVVYIDDEIKVYIPVLFFKIYIYPKKLYKRISQKKFLNEYMDGDEKLKEALKEGEEDKEKEKKKKSISDMVSMFKDLLKIVKDLVSKFNEYLSIKVYSLKADIASGDAAKTAIIYGGVSGAVSLILELINSKCNVRYKDESMVGVSCNFVSEKPVIDVDIRFRLFVWQAVALAFRACIKFIKTKLKNTK